MFDRLKKKHKEAGDEKLLASHRMQDAAAGKPTQATLDERLREAALQGCWKTAFAALEQGADPNTTIEYATGRDSEDKAEYPVSFFAISQDNPAVLRELLKRGADRLATGVYLKKAGRGAGPEATRQGIFAFAVLTASAGTMNVLLEAGPNEGLRDRLNEALLAAAPHQEMTDHAMLLINHDANNLPEAIRRAEAAGNKSGALMIGLRHSMIRQHFEYISEGHGLDRQKEALSAVFGKATAGDRRALLTHLKESFAEDFDAFDKEQRALPQPRPKNILNM